MKNLMHRRSFKHIDSGKGNTIDMSFVLYLLTSGQLHEYLLSSSLYLFEACITRERQIDVQVCHGVTKHLFNARLSCHDSAVYPWPAHCEYNLTRSMLQEVTSKKKAYVAQLERPMRSP